MQIQTINSYSKTNQQTNFKAAYPVIYWVKDAGKEISKDAPTISKDLTEKLQRKLVGYLNRTFSKSDPQKVSLMGKAFSFLRGRDRDFSTYPIVRSFYDTSTGSQKEGIKPIGYLLTGKDVEVFENNFAKPIGRNRANSPIIDGKPRSAELNIALDDYYTKGLNYVKNRSAQFCNKEGMP